MLLFVFIIGAYLHSFLLLLPQESIAAKEEEVEERRKEVDLRKAEREAAEAPEKEALDKYRQEEERQRQAKEELEKQQSEAEAMELFQRLDANQDGKVAKDELQVEPKFDTNNDGIGELFSG